MMHVRALLFSFLNETHAYPQSRSFLQKTEKGGCAMAEKDIMEKTLIAYNDVFADIINVLLFGGKRIVKENELQDAVARSMYKADGKLHEMERDTAKYWKQTSFRIALIGI